MMLIMMILKTNDLADGLTTLNVLPHRYSQRGRGSRGHCWGTFGKKFKIFVFNTQLSKYGVSNPNS